MEKKKGPDGLWHVDDFYWSMRRTPLNKSKVSVSNVEIVDWGRKGPRKMITLSAPTSYEGSRPNQNLPRTKRLPQKRVHQPETKLEASKRSVARPSTKDLGISRLLIGSEVEEQKDS